MTLSLWGRSPNEDTSTDERELTGYTELLNESRNEAIFAGFPLVDVQATPNGASVIEGQLVSGNVVMGTGYLKQLTASLRTLVGGEVKGYQRVLDRARREAQLRMIEEASQRGATAILNVRFETTDVGGQKPFSEIFCYGTMIRS